LRTREIENNILLLIILRDNNNILKNMFKKFYH